MRGVDMRELSPAKKFLEGLAATTVVVVLSTLLVAGVWFVTTLFPEEPVIEEPPAPAPVTKVPNNVQDRLKAIEAKRAEEEAVAPAEP